MKQLLTFLLSFIMLSLDPILAQEWTGAVNNDWNNPGNWNEWPLNDENVTIDPSYYSGAMASPVISSNSTFVPDRMFVVNGGVVLIEANLTVDNRVIIEDDGSSIVMSAGTLTCERLIAESGGLFNLTNGTVNVLSVLALGDDGIAPSAMVQQGGVMNVSGEFGFDVVLEISQPIFQLNGGSLTVNGEAMWYSESPGGGSGRVIINGGTAQINGPISANPGGPLDIFLMINGGTLTTNGPIMDLAHTTDSVVMTGGEWHLTGNMLIDNDGVLHIEGGEVLFDQNTELRGYGTYRFHDLSISSGATLTHTEPGMISISGDWNNMGSFDPNDNTVKFMGSAGQLISPTTFHGLDVQNSGSGITLTGPVMVESELQLVQGIVHSSTTTLLTLLGDALVSAGSYASHVEGPMRKIGNNDMIFPVGSNGEWRRIGISGITDADAEFTAQYFNTGYANTTSLGPLMISVSDQEYWSLQRAGTEDQPLVTLYWEAASESGIAGCDGLVAAYWDGAAWQAQPSTTNGGCTGNDAGNVTSTAGAPVHDVFTIGYASDNVSVQDHSMDGVSMHHDRSGNMILIQGTATTSDLVLTDIRGALIMQKQIQPGTSSVTLPLVAPGVYQIRLWSATGAVHQRILVDR